MNTKFWQNNKVIVDINSYIQILTKNNITEILFLAYSPVLNELSQKFSIHVICDSSFQSLIPNCIIYENLDDVQRQFECVLAPDEWFTFYATEDLQKEALSKVRDRVSNLLITTLQDYKNGSPQKITAQFLVDSSNLTIVQKNVLNPKDSQQWRQWLYVLESKLQQFGPTVRRTLYFKQFARYCQDLGCLDFSVDKTTMWTGNFGRTHEHWIIARFK